MRRMSRVVLHIVYVIDHWIIRHINIMVLHVTFPCKKIGNITYHVLPL